MNKPRYLKLQALLPALLFILLHSATAQITFQKEYYKSTGAEYAMAVTQDTNSNAYYFAGLSDEGSVGHNHLGVVAKTNFKGVWQWARITSTDHHAAGWTDIKSTYAGNALTGIIVAGHSYYPDFIYGGSGFRLARMTPSGTTTLYKSYTPVTTAGCSQKVEQATLTNGSVDGFITAGYRGNGGPQVYVVRTDESLAVTWSTIFTYPSGYSRAFSVKQTADKGFIVTGEAYHKIFVMKLDASGAISWQKIYQLPSTYAMGDDILEVMNGVTPEYYVLVHTFGPSSDVAILHIDDTGAVLNSKYYGLSGTQVARGMVYLPSGHITFTATTSPNPSFMNPILVKTDAALSTQVFGKRYTHVKWASCPVLTTDNGYIIGSSNGEIASNNNDPFYLIKTDPNGVSDCYESDVTMSISSVAVTVTNGTFTGSAGDTAIDLTSINPVTLDEEVICKDFCKGATYTTTHTYPHACDGQTVQLIAPCLNAAIIKWFKLPDLTTVIGTGVSYTPAIGSGNADYVSRCYDDDGCITYEVIHHFTVTPPPISIGQSMAPACYGQYMTLNGCGPGYTAQWINPAGATTSSVTIEAFSNQTYSVNCYDQWGCLVQTNTFYVEVATYPVVQVDPPVTICEGASYDLNSPFVSFNNCNWYELPGYIPVFGSVVSPTTTTSYFAECRDAQGCITYHVVEVNVTPAPQVGGIATIVCEGNQVVLNSFPGPGCNWTWVDVNTNLPVSGNGFIPATSGLYRGTCVDLNGCISYFDVYVDIMQWTVITQTVYAYCGQPFDFNLYSNLCQYGVNTWASLMGGQYVMFPAGWAPTQNITVYGFGTNVFGYCCRVELHIIVIPVDGCDGTSEWDGHTENKNSNTGMPDISEKPLVDVYPNPGKGIFNLKVQLRKYTDYAVKVSDMLGKVLINDRGNSANDIVLDLSGRAAGVYHVQVTIEGTVYTRKIILQ